MLLALEKIDKNECKPSHLRALQMSGRLIARVYEDLTFLLMGEKQKERSRPAKVDVAQKTKESIEFFLIKNLIDNAVKYTRPKGRIHVSLTSCRLTVKDSGVGIEKEKLKRIFERFERANTTEGGLGIGLDIVATICGIYGFTLDVDSKEGEGSEFSVDFSPRSVRREKRPESS